MVDVSQELVRRFRDAGINFVYAPAADSKTRFPCVTYRPSANSEEIRGDTLGYSRIGYMIEVWAYSYMELIALSGSADAVMRGAQFMRKTFAEQKNDGLYRRILVYERLIKEEFE